MMMTAPPLHHPKAPPVETTGSFQLHVECSRTLSCKRDNISRFLWSNDPTPNGNRPQTPLARAFRLAHGGCCCHPEEYILTPVVG